MNLRIAIILLFFVLLFTSFAHAGGGISDPAVNFPPSFASYHDADMECIGAILKHRIANTLFNLVATLIFLAAIFHTFLSSKFSSASAMLPGLFRTMST